jgi:heterodisulfide reductase subunit A
LEKELLPIEKIQQLCGGSGKANFGDVMVVGAGVSGIQASLDLADAGFKVYLVEKGPSIGGHMGQLDKTFPTNECST